jgi:hypothetical protein
MKIKYIFFISLVTALLGACQKESDVNPATGTFIRYFGSENNNDAVLAIEAGDGYILLSNVEIQISATKVQSKLKITKTDFNGQLIWDRYYPEFSVDENDDEGMKGASIAYLPETGYLIVGDWIKEGKTELLLLKTNLRGVLTDSITISGADINDSQTNYESASISGRAVVEVEQNSTKYFVALAEITNSPYDMFVGQFTSSDLSMGWNRKYRGNASNEIVNRLISSNDHLFWSATVTATFEKPDQTTEQQRDVRIVEAPLNSESTVSGDPTIVTDKNEVARDFCKTVGGWAVIGSTNYNGDGDIYLLRTTTSGVKLYERKNVAYNSEDANRDFDLDPYAANNGLDDPDLNDEGKSITLAKDGNLILLGTVETPADQQEIFLMKIDATTNQPIWRKTYGGADRDEGASVRSVDDGYLVFGTVYFGRSRKLVLMKLDGDGNL